MNRAYYATYFRPTSIATPVLQKSAAKYCLVLLTFPSDPRRDQGTGLAHGGAGEAVAVEVAVAVGVVDSSVVVARLSFSAVVVAYFSSVVVGGSFSSMVVVRLVRSTCDDGE